MTREIVNETLMCIKCIRRKPTEEFYTYKDKSGASYYRSWCKDCCRAKFRENKIAYGQSEEGKARERQRHVKRRYGLSGEEFETLYEELFLRQEGKCAVCKTDVPSKFRNGSMVEAISRFNVDHCHETNKIRGLLCGQCNMGLGLFKDNIEWLQNAIDYLQRNEIT